MKLWHFHFIVIAARESNYGDSIVFRSSQHATHSLQTAVNRCSPRFINKALRFTSRGKGGIEQSNISVTTRSKTGKKQIQATLMLFLNSLWLAHVPEREQAGYSFPPLQCLPATRSHKAGSSQLKAKEMLSVARRCFFFFSFFFP